MMTAIHMRPGMNGTFFFRRRACASAGRQSTGWQNVDPYTQRPMEWATVSASICLNRMDY
jgi:hypothetical protein